MFMLGNENNELSFVDVVEACTDVFFVLIDILCFLQTNQLREHRMRQLLHALSHFWWCSLTRFRNPDISIPKIVSPQTVNAHKVYLQSIIMEMLCTMYHSHSSAAIKCDLPFRLMKHYYLALRLPVDNHGQKTPLALALFTGQMVM